MRKMGWLFLAALCGLTIAARASAQTSAALVLVPWDEEALTESVTSVYGLEGSTSAAGAPDIDLFRFRTIGRARPTTAPAPWAIGWNLSYLDIDTADPALPSKLADLQLAGGMRLGQTREAWDHTWEFGAVAGVGFAGNAPFNDGDAWYGLASVFARTKLDNGAQLTVLLDYDGNRTVFPDIPLPGVAYSDRYNEELSYTLGVPVTSVTWTPDTDWRIDVRYLIPFFFTLRAEYTPHKHWTLFGSYLSETNGYWIDGGSSTRRLFFEQDRVELGVRFGPDSHTEIVGAVGYAFNQDFETGFDTRSTTTVSSISDEPYVRLALQLKF